MLACEHHANFRAVSTRSTASFAYSSLISIPVAWYPSCTAEMMVVPLPQKGSSICPPDSVILTTSPISCRGFSVRCMRFWGLACRKTPVRQGAGRFMGISPFEPQTMHSLCCLNLPFCGRQFCLSHTAIPRQIQPAHCMASVNEGNCLQSINTATGAPDFEMRRHSDSHSAAQSVHDLWSFASPSKAGGRVVAHAAVFAHGRFYLLRLGASARSIRGIADNGVEGITFKRFQYLKRIALKNAPIFVIVHEFSRFLL